MLRSINSPPDPHDDHLRQLLDQRATRADVHDRFSTLSQFSDTPSIYSRPFLSPRPLDNDPGSSVSASQLKSPAASTFSSRSHRDRFNDPTASMLDLDDDPRMSIASDIYDDQQQSGVDDSDESARRMSYLGPKMRFHSRAPWEMDEDALEEEDESDPRPTSKKGFGFSSPRTSNASRPSGESTRSQPKSKQSFETTSSHISYPRGALYALAQESLSTTSLGTSSPAQKSLRGKFSLNRVRSESPKDSLPPSPALDPRLPNNIPLVNVHSHHHTPDVQTSPSSSHRRPTYAADDFHPYANPDLVISFADDQSRSSIQPGVSRSDSNATVTDSLTYSSLSRSGTTSTLGVTSTSSISPRNRNSSVQGKEISSPIVVLNSTHHLDSTFQPSKDQALLPQPGVDNLPGWAERGTSKPVVLISLEEAREQRMRSATTQPAIQSSTSVSSGVSFPDGMYDFDNRGHSIDHSGSGPLPQRARARSISAGAKAKNAIHTIVGGGPRSERHEPEPGSAGPIPGKTLKHKKSGFMRLFNGGRGQEKEEKAQPPPVPSLSDAYAALNAHTVHKGPKITTHRVAVPDLSPSLLESSSSQEGSPPTLEPAAPMRSFPSPKRPIPPLSINTQPHGYSNRAPASAVDNPSFQTRTLPSYDAPPQPWLNSATPQSAPANVSEFPALKLRPVSTIFSAQFGDHIVTKDSRPSLESDVDTPGSSTNIFSPVTPGSATRSDRSSSDNKLAFMTPITEDQSSVINALRDQMLNAKLAWQRQIWELESQVRDLQSEIDDLRKMDSNKGYCETCGRGQRPPVPVRGREGQASDIQETKILGVVNRPRARTGTSSRFGSTVS
ncbi:hypothetical protein D9615_001408 [Tricholomella constricta]|uniref:Uncharacterized protein n=1 Tax=Tricholomella constricta TaxID=117010 RepID=A0A8H5M8V1_9AGAR|nr:hypothetical protein D9615_001408 [Tricholomella constricta]